MNDKSRRFPIESVADIFSLPESSECAKSPEQVRSRRFELERTEDGFVLKCSNVPLENFPVRIRIEAGYAVRRGNAIKRWASDDFAFIRAPLRQEQASGVVVSRADGNCLELEIRQANFQFGISGFDTKRDLVVRAVELKEANEADV